MVKKDDTADVADLPPGSAGAEVTSPVPDLQTAVGGTGEHTGTATSAPSVGVFIHYRVGSAAGREAARRIAEEVRRAGLEVMGVSAEPTVPTMREILHPGGDAAAEAERLATRLRNRWGNAWRVQAREGPSLEQGRHRAEPRSALSVLEVWLPHR